MKGTVKILARPFKATMVNNELDKMLLGKEMLEWVHRTRNILANMGHAYNSILGQCTIFTRSKLDSLCVW